MKAGYEREALYYDPSSGKFVDITYPKHKKDVFEAALYGDVMAFKANRPVRVERFVAKLSGDHDTLRVHPSPRPWQQVSNPDLLAVGADIFAQPRDVLDVQDVRCVPQGKGAEAKDGVATYQPTQRTLNHVGQYDGPTNWVVTWTPWRGYKERTERIYRVTMPEGRVVYRVTYRPTDPTVSSTVSATVEGFREEVELPEAPELLDRHFRTGTVDGFKVTLREARTYATERDRGVTGAQIGWKVIESECPKRFRSQRPIRIEDDTKPKGFKYVLLYASRKGDPMVELEDFDEAHIEDER